MCKIENLTEEQRTFLYSLLHLSEQIATSDDAKLKERITELEKYCVQLERDSMEDVEQALASAFKFGLSMREWTATEIMYFHDVVKDLRQ